MKYFLLKFEIPCKGGIKQIYHLYETVCLSTAVITKNIADYIANSVDPDQTAPSGAV